MKVGSFGLALLWFALVLPSRARSQEPKFDEVILVEAKKPQISLLYVVLTEPKAGAKKGADLVLKYAKAALREATAHKFKGTDLKDEKYKHEGNVVFFIRSAAGDEMGTISGFSVEQLREI